MNLFLVAATPVEMGAFFLLLVVIFCLLAASAFTNWWLEKSSTSPSPYTGIPLRKANDLSYDNISRVFRFLVAKHQYDNRPFSIQTAAFCRETGRIFPDCITWYDAIVVDWNFIQKRYPGSYVSWGSLTKEQKEALAQKHDSLDEFQTKISCPIPQPRLIEPQYIYEKPGPLYVDVDTGILLGWQRVPETELEVLVVQAPSKIIIVTLPKEEEDK